MYFFSMSGKSDIWNHFIKKDSGGNCKYCHQEVKTKGNTTNLRNHLLRRHPTIQTVSLKKRSASGGGNCSNARDGDGQVSGVEPVFLISHSLFSNILSLNKIRINVQ